MPNNSTIKVTEYTKEAIHKLHSFDVENSELVSYTTKLETFQFHNKTTTYAFGKDEKLVSVCMVED